MAYDFLDHTADVAVELTAESREDLFAEALSAFTDTITEVDHVHTDQERELEVAADNLEELMVEWLGELVYRFDVDGMLFSEVSDLEIEETDDGGFLLTASAHGEPYDEERHPLKVEVKGVTYHELKVERTDGSWRGRVIFDV